MSVTCGFFNAVNHDRRYDAKQMSALFDGIINDGVFMNIGDALAVKANPGDEELHNMNVYVKTGRCWFNSTWTHNDAILPITIEDAELVLDRVDTIVLEVNTDDSVRACQFKVIKGTPATAPIAATLENSEYVHQYAFAKVRVNSGATEILQENITNCIGTDACPYITGILETISAEDLLDQWENEFSNWMTNNRSGFTNWFNDLKVVLDGDIASHLQNEINVIFAALVDNGELITELKSNFQDGVNTIVTAINTKTGATIGDDNYVDGSSTPEEIADIIVNGLGGFQYLGTATSYNMKELMPTEWEDLTVDNFLVETTALNIQGNCSGGATGVMYSSDGGSYTVSTNANSSNNVSISKSYTNGVFSVSGLGVGCSANKTKQDGSVKAETSFSASCSASIKVYFLKGDMS